VIRIGVVGVGYWGPNLVRTLNEIDGAEVVRVADLRSGRREFIDKRFPGVETTPRSEDVLLGDDIDAVFIASPPETHCDLAIAALQAGKHVFVEKPMATRIGDAERMAAVAEERGRKLAVGHLFLYHPAIVTVKNLLQQGELGDIYFISSTRANLGPPNAKADVVWDLAPHDISIVLHLMGERPAEITARGASFTNSNLIETAYVNLQFPSGRMAQVNVSWLTPNKTRRLEVVCNSKTVIYDDMQPVHKVQVFDAGVDNRKKAADGDAMALGYGPGSMWCPAIPACEPLRAECEDFLRCVENGGEPLSSGREAVETVRVLQAASELIRAGSLRQTLTLNGKETR
jgi:predicted dehydrogenase